MDVNRHHLGDYYMFDIYMYVYISNIYNIYTDKCEGYSNSLPSLYSLFHGKTNLQKSSSVIKSTITGLELWYK